MQPACDGRQTLADCDGSNAGGAVETRVDVARSCYFKSGETLQRTERGDDLLRDNLGSLAQFARQFKRDGSGQFAESQVGRNFNRDGLELEIVLCLQAAAKVCGEPILEFQIHVGEPLKSLIFKGDSNTCGGASFPFATATRQKPTRSRLFQISRRRPLQPVISRRLPIL